MEELKDRVTWRLGNGVRQKGDGDTGKPGGRCKKEFTCFLRLLNISANSIKFPEFLL